MADESREDYEARVAGDLQAAADEYRETQLSEAKSAREDEPSSVETDEEYYARVQAAATSGIFGDTDTTGGAGASTTDVPSANNEAATVAVAEVDSAAELGDREEGDEVSQDEARRQVDVAGAQPSAEEVDAGAEDRDDDDDGGLFSTDDDSDDSHDDHDQALAADKIRDIEAASSVDSVLDGDQRVTVKRAADKRKGELA